MALRIFPTHLPYDALENDFSLNLDMVTVDYSVADEPMDHAHYDPFFPVVIHVFPRVIFR